MYRGDISKGVRGDVWVCCSKWDLKCSMSFVGILNLILLWYSSFVMIVEPSFTENCFLINTKGKICTFLLFYV